jgi:hypothetical protein
MAITRPLRSKEHRFAECGPTLIVAYSATLRISHSFTTPSASVDAIIFPCFAITYYAEFVSGKKKGGQKGPLNVFLRR